MDVINICDDAESFYKLASNIFLGFDFDTAYAQQLDNEILSLPKQIAELEADISDYEIETVRIFSKKRKEKTIDKLMVENNYNCFYHMNINIRNIFKKVYDICSILGLNAHEVSKASWRLEHSYHSNFPEVLDIDQIKNAVNKLQSLSFSGSAQVLADEEDNPTEYLEELKTYIVSVLGELVSVCEYAFSNRDDITSGLSEIPQIIENEFNALISPIKENFQNYLAEKSTQDYDRLEVTAGLFQKLAEQNIYLGEFNDKDVREIASAVRNIDVQFSKLISSTVKKYENALEKLPSFINYKESENEEYDAENELKQICITYNGDISDRMFEVCDSMLTVLLSLKTDYINLLKSKNRLAVGIPVYDLSPSLEYIKSYANQYKTINIKPLLGILLNEEENPALHLIELKEYLINTIGICKSIIGEISPDYSMIMTLEEAKNEIESGLNNLVERISDKFREYEGKNYFSFDEEL